MSAVELHLSLYVPCRSGVSRASPRKCTKEEWLASPSAATAHCRIVAVRIAAGRTAVDTVAGHIVVGTVVARTAVAVDIAMVVVPRAAAEMVLDHGVVEVDPDYNS